MAMTVSYSVVPRKNPAKKSEPAKYYAQMCVLLFQVFFMR